MELTVDSERAGRLSSSMLVVKFTSVQSTITRVDVEHCECRCAIVRFHTVLGTFVDLSTISIPARIPSCSAPILTDVICSTANSRQIAI